MIAKVTCTSWGVGAQRYYQLTKAQCIALAELRAFREPKASPRTYDALRSRGLVCAAPNYGEPCEAGELALTDKGRAACVDLFDTRAEDFLTKHPEAYR